MLYRPSDLNVFVVQAWKSYWRPKICFWGILPPKFRGTSFRPQKGTSLRGTTRFEPSIIGPDLTHSATCGLNLAKKTKKEKKWQTGYSPRPLTSPYRSQSLHAGWSPVCSSIHSRKRWKLSTLGWKSISFPPSRDIRWKSIPKRWKI